MEKIYDITKINMLLGCLLKDPSLSSSEKYPLCKDDFVGFAFDNVLFVSIYNLYKNGYKSISFFDLDKYLQKHEAQYEIFKDCREKGDVEDFLETIMDLCDLQNYENYYNDVRRLSCIRDYRDSGVDVKKFWDFNKSDIDNLKGLEGVKVEEVVGYFELNQIKINQKYVMHTKIKEMVCGDNFDELLDELQKEPLVGAQLSQPILTNLFRGWCKGHLILRASPSSFGKTLMGGMDILIVGSKKLYNEEKNEWYDNPYYRGKSAILHSEQTSKYEIQTRLCSVLSKVPYHTELDGAFTDEEKERLSMAGKITKESGIKIINYPEFTASGMRALVKRLALEGYEYIYQDYVWNNSHIVSDMKKTMNLTNVSEPNALLYFVNELKLIAEDFNVGMMTSMQLNDSYKTVEIIDEGCLYASKAVKTKLDCGFITTTPRAKDLVQIESLISKWNKKFNDGFEMLKPNMLCSCFKVRYGRYGENVRIWSHIDKGTGKVIDMFATSADNEPIKIEPLYIERKIIADN